MQKDFKKIMVTESQIKIAVSNLGKELTTEYKNKKVTLIGLLKGAYVFMADLAREMHGVLDLEVEFMAVKSYINSRSSAKPKIVLDIKADIQDRHVIIVEDIIETGNTLETVVKYLKYRGATDIKIAALLSKDANRAVAVNVDYKLFRLDNEFVVGYGLDYNEKYRHLKDIMALTTEAIEKYKN